MSESAGEEEQNMSNSNRIHCGWSTEHNHKKCNKSFCVNAIITHAAIWQKKTRNQNQFNQPSSMPPALPTSCILYVSTMIQVVVVCFTVPCHAMPCAAFTANKTTMQEDGQHFQPPPPREVAKAVIMHHLWRVVLCGVYIIYFFPIVCSPVAIIRWW